MKKIIIKVPKDIRFLGDWKEFCLPDEIAILDKQITGCGFTEYCIKNDEDIILCSPRKILLEDKAQQHIGKVYYIKNEYEIETNVDKDLTAEKPNLQEEDNYKETTSTVLDLHKRIELAYEDSKNKGIPCKILVTYDSFRHVKEVFTKLGILGKFRIVVDEFQSIFTDSKFKSTTEIEFLNHLNKTDNEICFVSATPMIEKYLDELDEFKDLPYYELDWESEDPNRIIIPKINVKQYTKGLTSIVSSIINSYKEGNYDSAIVEIDEVKTKVESREAVFYVNSVKNICDIIKKNHLTLENTNVLCARTDKNEKALKKAFGVGKKINVFGRVPTKGESHKMFTLCTRTVYLGADFYSTNAKSYIFSDANIDSLAVDISLDLPQILGRQRLVENPWKNRADLYCKLLAKDLQKDPKEFTEYLNNKQKRTKNLLLSYESTPNSAKHDVAETYQFVAINANYKNDYIAVNKHAGSDLKPVFNKLVMLSEIRAFEIQQVDYKDRFRLFNSLKNSDKVEYDDEVANIIECIDLLPYFNQKMKYLYDLNMSEELAKRLFDTLLDTDFSKYYYSISKEKAGTLKYNKKQLEKEYNRVNSISSTINLEDLPSEIYTNFTEGSRYSKSYIKEKLKEIYDKLGYSKTAKANDLEEYFEVKECRVLNIITNKRDSGFELIKKR